MIVALLGRNRVGKDTVGARLVEKHGFTRVSIADRIRSAALALDPVVRPGSGLSRLSEVVDQHGWEWCKDNLPEVRRLLIYMGREVPAVLGTPNLWTDLAVTEAGTKYDRAVITDMRYPREVERLKATTWESRVWRIVRDTGEPIRDPIDEEWEKAPYDFEIVNDWTIEHLHLSVDWLAARLF